MNKLVKSVTISFLATAANMLVAQPTECVNKPRPAAQDLVAFSLQDRQVITPYITKLIPELEKQIKDATGVEIVYDINWKEIAAQPHGLTQLKSALKKITAAVVEIAVEPIGKDTVAKKIKIIRLKQAEENDVSKRTTLNDGVLQIIPRSEQWRYVTQAGVYRHVKELL